jgi:hypothetical protein
MDCLRIALVSKSPMGGNRGRVLYGRSGSHALVDMSKIFAFFDTFLKRVDAVDTSRERVHIF